MKGSARDVAAMVLVRVYKDDAFASAALEAELSRFTQLDARDRSLVTELVYGTLRFQLWIDAQLAGLSTRGSASVDAHVRARLSLAIYQIAFTRVPAFAAVSEAVDGIRALRGPRMAAFANAVLRKLTRGDPKPVDRAEALMASTAPWMRAALSRALTEEGARAFLASGAEPPRAAIRVEDAEQRCLWIERLQSAAPEASFEAGALSPLAILARGAGKLQRLPGWSEGAWSVQEEGSQLAAMLVGARPGEHVLDACSGRGNKAAILARAAGPAGGLDACDAVPAKLARLSEEFVRLGLTAKTMAVDWRVGSGEVTGLYDRILVDAPCSGSGTLRRRPEIALRSRSEETSALSATQLAILSRASEHLRPGGTLVYVVCSVLREEAEDVLERFRESHPDFDPAPFDAPETPVFAQGQSSLRLLPHLHLTDGYFVARLARRPAT